MNDRAKILWKLGPVFTERETYGDDDLYGTYITETCGTCVTTQVEPNPGVQGIAKIRMQYADMTSKSLVSHNCLFLTLACVGSLMTPETLHQPSLNTGALALDLTFITITHSPNLVAPVFQNS